MATEGPTLVQGATGNLLVIDATGRASTIAGNLGQAASAASEPVVIASDQSPVAVKGATANATQPANTAANTVVKGSSGRLWAVVVTTTGTAALSIFDNASTNAGTILLTIAANAAVGTVVTFPEDAFAANGIVSGGVLNCPGVTFQFS